MIPLKQVWPDDMAALYRAKGYWRGETFSQVLRSRAEAQPDAVAVVGMDQRWTYGDLLEKAEAAAAGFLALGLKPGDRVVVQLPNLPEFLSVIFGLFRAQLIPVYALPAHRSTEIVHFVARAEASAYVVADRHEGFDYRILARAVQGEIPDLRHVVVVGEAEEFAAFDDFLADPAILPVTDADPSSVAFLQISGGSTGLSKLIPRTHDDYLYSVRESADISGLEPESVYLTALPAAHNFPMSSPGYLGALYVGATVVMVPSPSPDACFPLIEREGVTITGLVPPLALLWMQAASRKAHDLSSLQVLLVGGAKFLPEAARRVRTELGCTLQQVFGMAEGLVNYTRLDDDESLIVETQGRPISPDDEILILDDAGAPVLEGEAGDLLTRGPYTIRAYHNEPGANARSFTDDGFYRTGDVVRRTPEGYLVVMGRATDHINRAGEKISAEEVEDHLLAHPAVFDAAVVSVPDEYLGERICAFVIPRGDAPRGVELKAWMRQRDIAAFKVPDQIVFVEDFAVTAVGKVSRRELRAALRQRIVPEEDHA
ncbi:MULTISPECIES: (2,3-dihydroxybenzoyl)adenylate synthase [unclassified Brevundimonas]|uniref:(2,3-dihydroxybenzoyl)adenylate synthase n=1 Tax=unclassified Brevundimonas TaxID=2622653 RepID=UPI0025C036C4|nr:MULTISPECIES: AMP-binding protein [unclassified Brevundimonas]